MRGWEYEGWGQDGGGESNEGDVLMGGQFGVKENPDARQIPRKPQG